MFEVEVKRKKEKDQFAGKNIWRADAARFCYFGHCLEWKLLTMDSI